MALPKNVLVLPIKAFKAIQGKDDLTDPTDWVVYSWDIKCTPIFVDAAVFDELKAKTGLSDEQKAAIKALATDEEKKDDEDEDGGLDGLDDDDESTVTFTSQDGVSYVLDRNVARMSKMAANCLDGDTDATDIPIPAVHSIELLYIVQFMVSQAGIDIPIIPKPLRSKNMSDVVKEGWHADFITAFGEPKPTPEKDQPRPKLSLYPMYEAVNYMDINGLLHLCAAHIAALIKGEQEDRIHEILNPDDATRRRAAVASE